MQRTPPIFAPRLAGLVTALGLALLTGQTLSQERLEIEITKPAHGAIVARRPTVEGTVSDAGATVWVVVNPLPSFEYWVQPRVRVHRSGAWKVEIYIGRPGDLDRGKTFEIIAVANPTRELREGVVLGAWPDAEASSAVVEVTRR